jgi:hypothetical protein
MIAVFLPRSRASIEARSTSSAQSSPTNSTAPAPGLSAGGHGHGVEDQIHPDQSEQEHHNACDGFELAGNPIRDDYLIVDGGQLAGAGAHSYSTES